ncbi:putative F-box domain, leucine-rich repeat domain superfamily, F-box-like domain superfamily [Helianthus annuus]|uniref:F-box domain, leucine-rich repeat domain superfamily, F-box-like domain superfamily n=1 Tax=Helianthus annuus TaxID=4232 RepID=A0A251RQQ4_HELAN|nr:putative F-box domain, leucine-rich repeat domain superfamily, F-box-like domain superfamily [Helianthus annuus]
MDSRHGKVRLKVEVDRLSNLPNDLIHKILSFIDVKYAIRTSALSSRWRYIWTSMPCLNFSSEGFHSLPEFSKFVTRVLSTRNNKTEVHYVKLAFCGKDSEAFVKRILKYAFSHNVQQLDVTCLPGKKGYHEDLFESPVSVFNSQSLKSLTMSGYGYRHYVKIPPTWYLPALTTLNLFCVALHADDTTDKCAGLLSNCANLKNLTLNNCRIPGGISKDLHLCHIGLSNLTLEYGGYNAVYVDTPQLKKFTVINFPAIHLVSAPNLASLHYKDDSNNYYGNLLKVSAGLLHLENVDLCIQFPHECKDYAQDIVCLLQQLHSVKFLTLNLELLKVCTYWFLVFIICVKQIFSI